METIQMYDPKREYNAKKRHLTMYLLKFAHMAVLSMVLRLRLLNPNYQNLLV